jgi:hypothetical protein
MCSTTSSDSVLVKMQNGAATLEDSLLVSYKLNICLPYDPAIVLLGFLNDLQT